MIDFLVKELILPILEFFHVLTGNYGWAIILLTVSVKILLMPLTIKQFRSMRDMQKVQPKLQEIQKKYKAKPEELNKKVMEFYKEHKVNPFAGCLPLLIQMPFLIALYSALYRPDYFKINFTPENSSLLGIQNMSTMGVSAPKTGMLHFDNIILIILFGITTFISQKMMTKSNDPMQRQMLYTMPLMITLTFVFFPVPSGVLLYLVISNSITIFQNIVLLQEGNAGLMAVKQTGQEPVILPEKKVKEDENDKKKLTLTKSQPVLKNNEEPKHKKKHFSSLNNSNPTPGKGSRHKKKKWN